MADLKLTKKKKEWVQQFKPQYVEGTPLKPNIRIEQKFRKKIEALTNAMLKEYEREIKKLFKTESPSFIGQDASISSQVRILLNQLSKKYLRIFDVEGKSIVDTMVSQSDKQSKNNIKESLNKITGGLTIDVNTLSQETKEMIKASSNQAAAYIKSIPQEYIPKVEGSVYRSITSGNGLQDLIPDLQKISGQTQRRAKNIALDQTRKVTSSIDKARMKQVGVKKFKWLHTFSGAEPRKNHMSWNGKIFSFDDLPYDETLKQKVYVGEAPYCRCVAIPVWEFNQE